MIAPNPPLDPRWARWILAILCALGFFAQLWILEQALRENPFARTPINDARVYWDWAGEIARGKLVGATPYLSAPLYPHVIAVVRALGGDLAAVYVLQIALHVATAVLLFAVGARRFAPSVGLVAALAWLTLGDPAAYTTRILSCTLQAFVVAWLWHRMIAVAEALRLHTASEPLRLRGACGLGLILGLNVLANPTMLIAVPVIAVWLFASAPTWTSGARFAGAMTLVALLAVAPATWHNWLAAREWIPVSAQAGVTFYHGNAPGADGTYHAIPGISSDRIKQNLDARAVAGAGRVASWRETSAAFFDKGLAYWRAEPASALALAGRKLWWFLSGRNYGDIYVPALEIEAGFASRLALACLPVAWLVLPACALAASLARAPRRYLPELLLLIVPLATVVGFWYSPRYRFPALPVIAVLAAAAGFEVAGERFRRPRVIALSLAFAVAIGSGAINRTLGFDRIESYRAQFEQGLGSVLLEQGSLEGAARHFERALELGHGDARASLGDVERRLGRSERALEMLRESVRLDPQSVYARRSLAVGLAGARRFEEARVEFEAALALDPNDWESLSGLGNVLLELGRTEAAIERYRAALAANPAFASARSNLAHALARTGRGEEAEAEFRAALTFDERLAPARKGLADLLTARGAHAEAIAILRNGHELDPQDVGLANALAWMLATAPAAGDRDRVEALSIVEQLDRTSAGSDPGILDTLAAALAENGRFEEAVRVAERSLAGFRSLGVPEEIETEVAARIELYRAGRAYHQQSP